MEKKELQVIALSNSESSPGNFVLVMEELITKLRLPIIIGGFEAQAIAVHLEGMNLPRPLTHDLFKNSLQALGASLTEVLIHNIIDGIFYACIIIQTEHKVEIKIDARPSDAIALAVRYNCPVYVYDFILKEAGIAESEKKLNLIKGTLEAYSIAELEKLLTAALAKEDYESAAHIRDIIDRRKL